MKTPCIIIAEAGVNHNGSLELAKKLIDAAVHAGVDFVKFQTFKPEKVIVANAPKAQYQIVNTGNAESQLEMIRKLQLSESDHFELVDYCEKKKIKFLSTAFDLDSIDLLVKLGVTIGKVPSGEINNVPYLRKMAKAFGEIILSTGMSTMEDISFALNILNESGISNDRIVVLHCNTEYPTPLQDVNLLAMHSIKNRFSVQVGYSDHTNGILVPVAAVALGAVVIEKHFTLDKTMDGPDHKASLEPGELKNMVSAIRDVEKVLGSEIKSPSASEQGNISIARRSIVAATAIRKGEIFTEENLAVKRPGTGLSPVYWDQLIGKKSERDYQSDEFIVL